MNISRHPPETVRKRWEDIGAKYLIWHLLRRSERSRADEYSLVARYRPGRWPLHCTSLKKTGVWRDAPVGLMLFCNGEAAAYLGFTVDFRSLTLTVMQIQGLPKTAKHPDRDRYLRGFAWDAMLCEIAVAIAEDFKLKRVEIRPVERNEWYAPKNEHTGAAYLKAERRRAAMVRHYNDTAMALGFQIGFAGNFQLKL